MIQDKPNTRFGKWIHGVLTYINFEQKKLQTAALTPFTSLKTSIVHVVFIFMECNGCLSTFLL